MKIERKDLVGAAVEGIPEEGEWGGDEPGNGTRVTVDALVLRLKDGRSVGIRGWAGYPLTVTVFP